MTTLASSDRARFPPLRRPGELWRCANRLAGQFVAGLGKTSIPSGYRASSISIEHPVRGKYGAKDAASAQCKACEAGRFAAAKRFAACGACHVGTYQSQTGQSSCISCAIGRTTKVASSPKSADCAVLVGPCDFESTERCSTRWKLTNRWKLASHTKTQTTGPAHAHSGTQFVFLETERTGNDAQGLAANVSHLTSSMLPQSQNGWISFYYHMFISATKPASLQLQVTVDSKIWTTVWSRKGPQQQFALSPWLASGMVQLPQNSTRVRFNGVIDPGGDNNGDLAVDSVNFGAASTCAAGKFSPASKIGVTVTCKSCTSGTFSTTGAVSCTLCPAGRFSASVGAVSPASCATCASGEHSVAGSTKCTAWAQFGGKKCKKHAPLRSTDIRVAKSYCTALGPACKGVMDAGCDGGGEYFVCDASALTSSSLDCVYTHPQTACAKGKYGGWHAQKTQCKNCASGTYAVAGVTTCAPCPSGKFQPLTGKSACIKCPRGRASLIEGASRCGLWVPIRGTHCNDDRHGWKLTTLAYAKQICQRLGAACSGVFESDAVCDGKGSAFYACKGQIPNVKSGTTCVHAPTTAVVCPAGKSGAKGINTTSQCKMCAAGKYNRLYGQATCATCPVNTYESRPGRKQCVSCSGDSSTQSKFGSTKASDCKTKFYPCEQINHCGGCDFDKRSALPAGLNDYLCGWYAINRRGAAWRRGSTGSAGSGAAKAKSGRHFIIFDVNNYFGSKGTTGYLKSPKIGKKQGAVSFSYHMYGATIGSLSLDAAVGARWSTVWTKKGQQHKVQNAAWTSTLVVLPTGTTQVRFAAQALQATSRSIALRSCSRPFAKQAVTEPAR